MNIKKEIMTRENVIKAIKRISYEIIEKNDNLDNIVLIGILQKGFPIAQMVKEFLNEIAEVNICCYGINISGHRDDKRISEITNPIIDINNKNVILVDDVLYTGRSVRAAMDALIDFGRPSKIQLAILVDRGHRELPIRADYVGKNIPTSKLEKIYFDTTAYTISIIS